jgi:hypothetical protein
MKRNENVNALLLNCRCNYTHFVIATSNIILTCYFYRDFKVYNNLSYPYIIEGGFKRKGNKFMIRRPDLNMNIFYELIESTITDYYSKFKYKIFKTIPESFEYFHQTEIRYINEDECTILSSLIYDNKIFFAEKEMQAVAHFQKKLYKNITLNLQKFTILKLSTTYIAIKCNIELIWDIIRNMKLIHKYVHLIGKKVEYNGEIIKKDIIIKIKDIKEKIKFTSLAKVNKCRLIKNESTKECVIELLFQNEQEKEKKSFPPFTEKKIALRIYELNGICSLYILYYFVHIHEYSQMENFTKIKNKELMKLKLMIENYKQYNNIMAHNSNDN